MLYDKRWEGKEVKIYKLLSLEGLISWLEKQPANEKYEWTNCSKCVFGQYLAEFGLTNQASQVDVLSGGAIHSPQDYADYQFIGYKGQHTFGAALERARRVLERQK